MDRQAVGVWERLHQAVLDELSEAEVLDWSRASLDRDGDGAGTRSCIPTRALPAGQTPDQV